MPPDPKTPAPDSSTPVEPLKIYLPACGVLCDIFWWARRNPSDEGEGPLLNPQLERNRKDSLG
jgi:hypothetical protein